MASILLKDVPESLRLRLKEEASRNRRSMAQEAMTILERSLRSFPAVTLPPPIKPLKPLTSAMILKAIRAGRK